MGYPWGQTIADLCKEHLGCELEVPEALTGNSLSKMVFEIRYIGLTKERNNGNWNCYGNQGVDPKLWDVVFPEDVLLAWFNGITPEGRVANDTLYSKLGIPQVGATDEVIKKAHRRMVKQWHPDVCQESDAEERFKAIQRAYELLKDPLNRRKYDAGLALEGRSEKPQNSDKQGYRTPLRCGVLTVESEQGLKAFTVSKILKWEDITNDWGQVLVTSWKRGSLTWTEVWT